MKKSNFSFILITAFIAIFSGCTSSVNSTDSTVSIATSTSNASYLNDLEKKIIDEINTVRKDPPGYAKNQLTAFKAYYQDKNIVINGKVIKTTTEGTTAVDDCFNTLNSAQTLRTLFPSKGLSQAAKDLVNQQGSLDLKGTDVNNISDPFERMDKYGSWTNFAAENVEYGDNEAQRIVILSLIDDGVSSRSHRNNILSVNFNYIGVATGSQKTYNYMTVMDFANTYQEK